MRLVMKMKRVMKLEELAGNGVPLNFTLPLFLQDVKVFSDPTDAFVTSNNEMSINAASVNESLVNRHTLVEQWNEIRMN